MRSADGVELHAEVFGPASAPTFVLIPGWTEELQIFDLLTRGLLGRGFRVVSYDPRGQGSSFAERGLDQSVERYAEDLTAVLEATCAGRDDVIVGGHSMGGMTLVAWAGLVDVSSWVRAVALISTGVRAARRSRPAARVCARGGPPRDPDADSGRRLADDRGVDAFEPRDDRYVAFGPEATAAQVAFVERMVWRMHGKLRAAAATTMRELDVSAALSRVNVPALVVVGDSDRLTPPVHARRMVAGLPQVAELVVLKRTGHMTPLERPEELAEALVNLAASMGLRAPEADFSAEPQTV